MARQGVGPRGGKLKYPSLSGRGGERTGAGRKTERRKTTSLVKLSIYMLRRAGALSAGAQFALTQGAVRIEGRVGVAQVFVMLPHGRAQIALHQTSCHLGGHRWWFRCPICHKRSAVLYLESECAGCRACLNLRYPSQSMTWIERSHLREANARARLVSPERGVRQVAPVKLLKAISDEQQRRAEVLEFLRPFLEAPDQTPCP